MEGSGDYNPNNTSNTQNININHDEMDLGLDPIQQEFVHPLLRLFMQSLLEIPQEDFQDIQEQSFQEQQVLQTPCSIDFINKLEELDIIQSDIDEKLSCAICQEEFKLGEKVVGVPCSPKPHYFHIENSNCEGIIPWLKKNNTCPVCRTEFPKEVVKEETACTRLQRMARQGGMGPTQPNNIEDDGREQEEEHILPNIPVNFNDNAIFSEFLQTLVNTEIQPINITNDWFVCDEVDEAIRRSLE